VHQGHAGTGECDRGQHRRRRYCNTDLGSLAAADGRGRQGCIEVCRRGRKQHRLRPCLQRREPLIARVKVDEDLPRQLVELLASRGHDAVTVVAQGWQGKSDDDLWSSIQGERRWLMTADKGFADLRKYPPGNHYGLILLRASEESRRAYMELGALALDWVDLDLLDGAVVVVTGRGVRIRRVP